MGTGLLPFKKGRAKTGGRVKGKPSKKVAERRRAEEEARVRLAAARLASQEEIEQAAARIHSMSPLDVMLIGMHLKLGRGDLDGAQKIAEAAAPYTSPRLNATDVRVQRAVAGKSDAAVAAEIEALRVKIQRAQSAPPVMIEGSADQPVSVDPEQTCSPTLSLQGACAWFSLPFPDARTWCCHVPARHRRRTTTAFRTAWVGRTNSKLLRPQGDRVTGPASVFIAGSAGLSHSPNVSVS